MENNTFGNSFLGITIGVILTYIFLGGDPDVVDAIREIILKHSGLIK